jgi:hypothetical protein
MAPAPKPLPKWVIDTHGMVDALTTTQNSARDAVFTAIASGEMLILKSVSDEISKLYDHLWDDFKTLTGKKYLHVTVAMVQTATTLSEVYGASPLGSMPSGAHFEAVSAARSKGCTLVSAGKALTHCSDIAKKCGLPPNSVVPISGV